MGFEGFGQDTFTTSSDGDDKMKGRERTSGVHPIVHPPQLCYGLLDHSIDLCFIADVRFDRQDLSILCGFLNGFTGLVQPSEVQVCDGDFAAAFNGEGDGCCAADTCDIRSALVELMERRKRSGAYRMLLLL